MPILKLRGGVALSAFRRAKLESVLRAFHPSLSVAGATFWHFVETDRPQTPGENEILQQLLHYGEPKGEAGTEPDGALHLVVPRLGTISPWASKATDIAHSCGLAYVVRIERGIAYRIGGHGARDARVAAALHDRMTESVLDSLAAADQLFRHSQPRPLATVQVLAGGRAALEQANAAMGLALSPDEIDYLLEVFRRLERDPTDVELETIAQSRESLDGANEVVACAVG